MWLVANHECNGPFRRAREIGGDEPLGPVLVQTAAFQLARYGLGELERLRQRPRGGSGDLEQRLEFAAHRRQHIGRQHSDGAADDRVVERDQFVGPDD